MSKILSTSSLNSTPVCAIIRHLYKNSPSILRLFYVAQTLGAFISLIALAFGMLQLCTKQPIQLPISSLLMMLNLCVALLLANVGVALSSLYNLHVPLIRAPSSHCYWLSFSFIDCLAIRTLLNVSIFATYMAGACLALERMAGSLLYIRRTKSKKAIAIFLVVLQWLISIFVAIPPILSSSTNSATLVSPHCALLTPSPTQTRPLFFAILGIHALVLAIYSILTYHHHFDPQIAVEVTRQNPLVLEQVHSTEQTLPAAATTVGLFILSTLLDRQFLIALANSFGFGGIEKMDERSMLIALNRNKRPEMKVEVLAEGIFKVAFWSEFQTLAVPFISLILVVVLQAQVCSQRIAQEEIYERVGGAADKCGQS
uniref:G-protein coupled receptors family 1 profile domain-containing protein n=1 Tax=Meloidogyne incognita TaxID=6306 RepID=A0A914L3G1_MELIC